MKVMVAFLAIRNFCEEKAEPVARQTKTQGMLLFGFLALQAASVSSVEIRSNFCDEN